MSGIHTGGDAMAKRKLPAAFKENAKRMKAGKKPVRKSRRKKR